MIQDGDRVAVCSSSGKDSMVMAKLFQELFRPVIFAHVCGGCLYSEAEKLGCNKIAFGHHFDDVIENILTGMLYGADSDYDVQTSQH